MNTNHPTPADLVVLDVDPTALTATEIQKVDALDWFVSDDAPNAIFVSHERLADCIDGLFDSTDPIEIGVDGEAEFQLISPALHRCDHRWYHA